MAAPRHAWFWLVVGLVTASQSGNIVRLGDAHPVAITFWRLVLSMAVLLPLASRELVLLGGLTGRQRLLLVGGGVSLAAHWFTWIAAVQQTTVANAAVFFSVNPVLLATAGHFLLGERVGPKLVLAIGLGIAGVAVMGGADLRLAPEHIAGDLWAVLCAALFAVYFLVGKVLRGVLPSRVYVASVYGTALVATSVVMLALELPFTGYDDRTWLCFAGMALLPTLLGHTGLNVALRYFDVGRLSVSTLSEPILAGLVAFLVWGEPVTPQTALGFGLIGSSVVVLVLDREPRAPAGQAPG